MCILGFDLLRYTLQKILYMYLLPIRSIPLLVDQWFPKLITNPVIRFVWPRNISYFTSHIYQNLRYKFQNNQNTEASFLMSHMIESYLLIMIVFVSSTSCMQLVYGYRFFSISDAIDERLLLKHVQSISKFAIYMTGILVFAIISSM